MRWKVNIFLFFILSLVCLCDIVFGNVFVIYVCVLLWRLGLVMEEEKGVGLNFCLWWERNKGDDKLVG